MTAKRMIFHVPFRLGYAISGGGIRPGKLIEAFGDLGYEVDVVSGDKAARTAAMDRIRGNVARGARYEFVYAESSVLPTMMTEKNNRPFYPFVDFDFFREMKRLGMKVGLFYRDIYWKFPAHRRGVPFVKRNLMCLFHHLELRLYAGLLDVLFVPSRRQAPLFPAALRARMVSCPPGHDQDEPVVRPLPKRVEDLRTCYVGGVSSPYYDISALFRLCAELPVTVCCRREEAETWAPFYGEDWNRAEVVHLSGAELKGLYARSALSAIIKKPHEYLLAARPLKLYEAVGQNIPILTNAGTLIAEFVEEQGVGWVFEPDLRDVNYGRILDEYEGKLNNLLRIRDEHHWRERARFIEQKLAPAGG